MIKDVCMTQTEYVTNTSTEYKATHVNTDSYDIIKQRTSSLSNDRCKSDVKELYTYWHCWTHLYW